MIEIRATRDVRWLSERTSYVPTADVRAIEALDGDRVIAQVAYDSWTPNSVAMHVAVDSLSAGRSLLRHAFRYPFAQREIVLGQIQASNKRSVRLAKHLGFREVYRVRDGWAAGVDLLLLEMRRNECRWLGKA